MFYIFVKNNDVKSVQYTSSIPADLMHQLDGYAGKFKIPKNRIIEEAIRAYFEKLKRAEYVHSFRKASSNDEMFSLAEEGFEDYLKILDNK